MTIRKLVEGLPSADAELLPLDRFGVPLLSVYETASAIDILGLSPTATPPAVGTPGADLIGDATGEGRGGGSEGA